MTGWTFIGTTDNGGQVYWRPIEEKKKMRLRSVKYQQEEIIKWLEEKLEDGPKPCSEIYKEALADFGWQKSAVYRAACALGISSEHDADETHKRVWSL